MVSLQVAQQSNALLGTLQPGLVAVFMGATSGIGQYALQHLARHAAFPHIYTVARPHAVKPHEDLLTSLRRENPGGTFDLIAADISLVSDIDKVVDDIMQKESKIDILFMSAGFMAFEGRKDTAEGLEPSMSTRYYSRLRAVQRLLPLLTNPSIPSPRVISVLAGGNEGLLNENDLDLREPRNWSFWNSSVHSATMGTLALEKIAQQNPCLSIVHWFPGPVDTPGFARAQRFGMSIPSPMSQEEAGARALFLATNDRYAVQGGLVPVPKGLQVVMRSEGGIFLVNSQGEATNNEILLAGLRSRDVDKKVWEYTEKVFTICSSGLHMLESSK